ncbi:dihydrolipoyl dehydrogenase [Polycyclovorans algicola]|uniref:dihydrolipoyl dehydrogenase n=1 Tax=Polycyclovorans algicola TaxID=616992 RepID=UPI0004A6C4C5|nr:dihydrolipoyl dehydrogenase [Polycyclovorans algicola]
MTQHTVDIAIIGAGSAGMTAYRAASKHTDSIVVIESGPYGTTCARVGCMPSKLLIAAAEAAHAVREAPRFGLKAALDAVDGEAVMQRVRGERDRFVGFVVDTVNDWPDAHRLRGHARFVKPGVLAVGDDEVHARCIIIATGSTPNVPEDWRAALGDRLIVNDDVFNWTTLPASVAVVGTGIIGLELAQALALLGVRVRLLGRNGRVGPLTEPSLQNLTHDLVDASLQLSADAKIVAVESGGDGVVVRFETADGVQQETFEYLLAATGRRPNLNGLNVEKAGIKVDDKGRIPFDRGTQQIDDLPVFIAGDVHGVRPLLHEASDDGRIAGDNAVTWPKVVQRPRRAPLAIVFSQPQIMMAGASHAELTADNVDFATGTVSFKKQGRARVMCVNQGALHVYGEHGSGRFLGAEMIGPAAEHLGHLLAWSVQAGLTVQQMLDSPFYHPVIEEGLRTALRDLQRQLKLPPQAPEGCIDCEVGG